MQKKLKKNHFTKFALMITALCLISTNIPLPHVQAASEIIVDNSEADFVGYWPGSTAVSGYYGSNYQYNVAGSGGDTASWSFSIPSAGVWEVFSRWTSHENRASNARYTVNHAGGSTVVVRNQELNGGTWVSLGDFSFGSGSYSVVLSDYADQYVIADAIRLVPVDVSVQYSLNVNVVGSGSVVKSPNQALYDSGSMVTLSAVPSSDYVFAGWSGSITGDSSSATLKMDADKTVTATFVEESSDSIIVDNSEADFVGYWYTSTLVSGYYGSNYQYNGAGSGMDTASWSFSISSAGVWEVFARWSSKSARASDAPYTVNHAAGSTTVDCNQLINGGEWMSLGQYSFGSGSYSVVLSDDANGYVIADAIKLVLVDVSAQYSLNVNVVGSGNVVKTPNQVLYDSGSVVTLTAAPASGYVFTGWSGALAGSASSTTLKMDGDKTVTATFAVASSEIIVDNSGADFVGYWPGSTAVSGYYGSNYQHNVAGSGGDTVSWSFSIPSAGVWEVFARWTSSENRASNARYTVNHAGGSTVVIRNQELNGGTWVSLGAFSFNSGSYSVVLSDYADQYVIADAIKLVGSDTEPIDDSITVSINNIIGTNKLSLGTNLDWDRWYTFVNDPSQQQLAENANLKLVRLFDFRKTSYYGIPNLMPCTYWNEATKTGTWDWTAVDQVTNAIFNAGAEPLFCLGWAYHYGDVEQFIPKGMAINPQTGLPYPDSYAAYAAEWVNHFKATGKPVRFYEIMNEPFFYFGWAGSDTTRLGYFMDLWNTCAITMRQQNPNIKISNDALMFKKVLNYWIVNGERPDFFDFHKYDADAIGEYSDQEMFDRAGRIKLTTTTTYYGIADAKQMIYDRWGVNVPAIATEVNYCHIWEGGTDPEMHTMTGAVWLGHFIRGAMITGLDYSLYYEFSTSIDQEDPLETGGLGFGMINMYDEELYYPYHVHQLIGSRLSVGDKIVSSTSSVDGITTLAWIHNGSPVLLVMNKETSAKTFCVQGISGTLDVKFIDGSSSSVQNLSVEQNKAISLNGYTVMVIK